MQFSAAFQANHSCSCCSNFFACDRVQVRDLMVFIEAQRLVEASGEDLQQATVLPVPEPQRGRVGQRQGRK